MCFLAKPHFGVSTHLCYRIFNQSNGAANVLFFFTVYNNY